MDGLISKLSELCINKPPEVIDTLVNNISKLSIEDDSVVEELISGIENITVSENSVVIKHRCGIELRFPLAISCAVDYRIANPIELPRWGR